MTRWIGLVLVSACAMQPGGSTPTGGGKGDGDGPTLTFNADFSQSASGSLVAGGTVRIAYALDRLTSCREESGGNAQWGVSGFAQFDGNDPVTFSLSRIDGPDVAPVTASVDIPRTAKHVALWFTETDVSGCIAYDSNEGANYQFDIDASSAGGVVLDFAADFTDTQSDAIHAGATAIVHYDPSRLSQCQASSGGHAAWGITGHWQVDGGKVHDLFVAEPDGTDLVAADPPFTVPSGSDLALWFEASSVYGCHAYDSNNSGNYHFTIE
jgi:hypothetical protein